jgi:hypothetical protein
MGELPEVSRLHREEAVTSKARMSFRFSVVVIVAARSIKGSIVDGRRVEQAGVLVRGSPATRESVRNPWMAKDTLGFDRDGLV